MLCTLMDVKVKWQGIDMSMLKECMQKQMCTCVKLH